MRHSLLSRREQIIISTIDLIHEIGITKLSVKEIAAREGVTEASLYKHFKNKDEILLCVMDYYMKYNESICLTVKKCEQSTKDKLFTYFDLYAEYYENYKAITALNTAYEVLLYEAKFSDLVKQVLEKERVFIIQLLKEGMEAGEFYLLFHLEDMAYVLIGTFKEIIHVWRLSGFSFSLKEKVKEVLSGLFRLYKK